MSTPTMTPRRLFCFGFAWILIASISILVVFEETSLEMLTKVDNNVPHRQASLLEGNDGARNLRFPSVNDRVKLYMSNWYVPPCPGNYIQVNRINATSLTIQESTTTEQADNKKRGRTLVLNSETDMNHIFFLDRHILSYCAQNAPPPNKPRNLQSYCKDVQSMLLPTLDRIGDDAMAPVFLQFGDGKESAGHGIVNIPQIKKIRSSTTQASLFNVTLNHCYSGPRDPLLTKHDNKHLQPILWKLNSKRHYSMLPDVQQDDIAWSLKTNMAVFRGALSGFPRGGYKEAESNFDNCMLSRRCRLAFWHDNSTLVDARLSSTLGRMSDTLNGVKLTGQSLSMQQQLQYKAIVVVEGNDVATGLKWALLSNSVVMMQPSSYTSWAMEELLEPWVHYIPLNEELSDVEEKMQWVLDNDEQARQIAERGTLWINDLALHPDAATDEKRIQEEIIRRYRAHFVIDGESVDDGSTEPVADDDDDSV